MCDVKMYSDIYKRIMQLQPEDTLQLILESEKEKKKVFYQQIGNYLLRNKQREVIERNLF